MDRQTTTYAVTFTVIALILGLRIWRGSRVRKLKIERLWVRPLIICSILALSIIGQPPPFEPLVLIGLTLAAIAGFFLGWFRGRTVRVSIDVNTHDLTSQASPWGMLILLAVVVIRTGARFILRDAHDVAGIPVVVFIDALTLLYAGSIVGLQLDVWKRARKLLDDAITAKAAGQAVPAQVTQDQAGEKPHG
jgi:hypothetical protein